MARVSWAGLNEFQAELRKLPDALQQSSRNFSIAAAFEMADAVRHAYPRGKTGRLQDGVIVRQSPTGAKVISSAPYAFVFEVGRQTGTHGTTPPRPTFAPLRRAYQRKLISQLIWLLQGQGATVRGGL